MTTKKPKRVRWDCPNAEHPGILAPTRLRRIDVRRFCLPCSEAAGVLVERVAPALARRREAAKETRARREKRKTATRRRRREAERTEAQRRRDFLAPYQLFWSRALRLRAWELDLATRPPRVVWRVAGDGCGRGRGSRRYVSLTLGVSPAGNLELILHELAHAAYEGHHPGFPRVEGEGRFHNARFRSLLGDAVEEITGTRVAGGTTGRVDRASTKALSDWLKSPECWWKPPADLPA